MLAVTPSPAARWQSGSSHLLETSSTYTADVRWMRLDASIGTHVADSGATRCCCHASVCVSAVANSAPRNGRWANSHGSDVAVGDGLASPLCHCGGRGGGCSDAEAHLSDRSHFPTVGKKLRKNVLSPFVLSPATFMGTTVGCFIPLAVVRAPLLI